MFLLPLNEASMFWIASHGPGLSFEARGLTVVSSESSAGCRRYKTPSTFWTTSARAWMVNVSHDTDLGLTDITSSGMLMVDYGQDLRHRTIASCSN